MSDRDAVQKDYAFANFLTFSTAFREFSHIGGSRKIEYFFSGLLTIISNGKCEVCSTNRIIKVAKAKKSSD